MKNNHQNCFNCGSKTHNTLYGFTVCSVCEKKMGLMTDDTITKHNINNPSFEKEAQSKLAYLEKDYARKKIKLLHILDRIKK